MVVDVPLLLLLLLLFISFFDVIMFSKVCYLASGTTRCLPCVARIVRDEVFDTVALQNMAGIF
jgi:hypothetical protein